MTQDLALETRTLEEIHTRIAAACARVGRDASQVLLIGASKTVSPEIISPFLQVGLRHIGENYVQEGIAKARVLRTKYPDTTFHFIGALQSNKAKEAVENFDFIHSVDRPSLVVALEKAARALGKTQNILLQVNLAGEYSKAGCAPENVRALADQVSQCAHLSMCGLMCLPPFHEDPDAMRPYFEALRTLRDTMPEAPSTLQLSMGMSNDYEVALQEGATMIRVGSALFGQRKK